MKKLMKIEGIHCGGCEGRLKRAMEALPASPAVYFLERNF